MGVPHFMHPYYWVFRLFSTSFRKRCFKFYFVFTFIHFWETETQSTSRGWAGREGDTESEAGSRLWAISTEPNTGLELMDHEIMTWAEVGHLTDGATQVLLEILNYIYVLHYIFIGHCCWRWFIGQNTKMYKWRYVICNHRTQKQI